MPTETVGNTFSVTLNSNHPLTGVVLDDFRFRIEDNSNPIIALTATNTTLAEVSGTNNWQLDIEVTGTLDADYTMRLRNSSVQYDGDDYPPAFLVSDAFSIDSSLDIPDFGSETIDDQAWSVGTAITSLTLPTATGGSGAITYSLSPTLPTGVTFNASTRVLSGNPTGRFTSATFTYTATDADGNTDELTFTIVVTASAITFDSSIANQSWTVGTAVNLTLPTASGGVGAFTYSLTPALPAGVTFTAGTRLLAGTPTGAVASATYTYTATDAESVAATRTFTIVVAAAAVSDAVFTITPELATIEAGTTADIDITSDVSVNGLTAADISVDSGTLGSLTGSGSSYTIPLTAPSTGSGTITITIRVDAVTQGNAETTADRRLC